MAGWVEEDSDILLRLVLSRRCSEGERLSDCGIEVADLEVEVHHRTLFPVHGGPDGGLVVACLLEDDVDRPLRRGEDGRSRFFVTDGPTEQLGVEVRQGAWVRRFDRGSPPHSVGSRRVLGLSRLRSIVIRGCALFSAE